MAGVNLLEQFIEVTLPGLAESLRSDPHWRPRIEEISAHQLDPSSVHLAVMQEPYLSFILSGQKTIESRFSINRIAPFNRVRKRDILLLKRSAGEIMGICEVNQVWFYKLNPNSWTELVDRFSEGICPVDSSFWLSKSRADYATLMQVRHVKPIEGVKFHKADRRGWVVLL